MSIIPGSNNNKLSLHVQQSRISCRPFKCFLHQTIVKKESPERNVRSPSEKNSRVQASIAQAPRCPDSKRPDSRPSESKHAESKRRGNQSPSVQASRLQTSRPRVKSLAFPVWLI